MKLSLIKRKIKFIWQKLIRGHSDDETWNLDSTISRFILPRLKRFKELNIGYPGNLTPEKWNQMLDDMIFYHECILDEEKLDIKVDQYWKIENAHLVLMVSKRKTNEYNKDEVTSAKILVQRYKRGKRYFHNYYEDLWW